jgi:hypothetical protein
VDNSTYAEVEEHRDGAGEAELEEGEGIPSLILPYFSFMVASHAAKVTCHFTFDVLLLFNFTYLLLHDLW